MIKWGGDTLINLVGVFLTIINLLKPQCPSSDSGTYWASNKMNNSLVASP